MPLRRAGGCSAPVSGVTATWKVGRAVEGRRKRSVDPWAWPGCKLRLSRCPLVLRTSAGAIIDGAISIMGHRINFGGVKSCSKPSQRVAIQSFERAAGEDRSFVASALCCWSRATYQSQSGCHTLTDPGSFGAEWSNTEAKGESRQRQDG